MKWESERAEKATDEEFEVGCKVRELREEGEPWWAIARALELEGAGDSATTGKKGAARARQAYTKAFGAHPRTFTRGSTIGKEKNESVKRMRETKQVDRIKKVKKGKGVIKDDMKKSEIKEMLAGRKITWMILADPENPVNETAGVHPIGMKIKRNEEGARILEFRQIETGKGYGRRGLAGRFRFVRLDRIHTIR